ncbi:Alpha-D-ribose 1-methylphosphonate 5-triphosphate synthase subunit PhnH [Rhodoplanes serenus]|uniref:Alpha-D-ribose 1-methylphosphonate 5-triphosphate synthase subunit PhnH n=1 Tax=Rhodoplanes serenus TaxID=200615 RepID=A0A3S4FER2_9BRAD|nr:phosphonate C-P lyase system protein PhnH [Rhodoplanes serenus]VCU10482.1 Alpha-D-ribose 1-methylphosphonate 5-triphosphate synthase subunit PhnH [Rhodoplanes serenus]
MDTLTAGFADPVLAAQATFRAVMDATARPGTVVPVIDTVAAPPPLAAATAAVALMLVDGDTPVWLDPRLAAAPEVAAWLRFHTGAPLVDRPADAAFAILADPAAAPPFEDFSLGTLDDPDRSATLILQVERFDHGAPLVLSGPGIADRATLRAAPLPPDMVARLAANRALFPRGVDLILTAGHAVAALPRSVMPVTER